MSNVYVGELTSEVHVSGAAGGSEEDEQQSSRWVKDAALSAALARVARVRARTSTGAP